MGNPTDKQLICRSCGYNLEGLPPDGRCPECGEAIGLSAAGTALEHSSPEYLLTVSRGLTIMEWGALLGLFVSPFYFFSRYLVGAIALGSALRLVGTWRVTSGEPRHSILQGHPTIAWVARSITMSDLVFCLAILATPAISKSQYGPFAPGLFFMGSSTAQAACLMFLCERTQSWQLYSSARTTFYWISISTVLAIVYVAWKPTIMSELFVLCALGAVAGIIAFMYQVAALNSRIRATCGLHQRMTSLQLFERLPATGNNRVERPAVEDENKDPKVHSISAVTLGVRDMARAVGFYQALGFRMLYGGAGAAFTSFAAGPNYLNLIRAESDRPAGWWGRVILYVDDVDAMHARAVAAGLTPEAPPRDAEWGERYFHITDPDGHELSFAQPLSGKPQR